VLDVEGLLELRCGGVLLVQLPVALPHCVCALTNTDKHINARIYEHNERMNVRITVHKRTHKEHTNVRIAS
jgi:hypothetical protein